jgi:type IV pilus assembly protein PilC
MRRRIPFSEKMFFTKHLSVMLKSGIPIAEILETLAVQAKSKAFKGVLEEACKDVSKGKSLEKAFAKQEGVFDLFYLSLIRVGEESGTLEESLKYLADKMEKENDLKKKVQSAMLYPIIILAATVVIGLGMGLFVLPKITDLFEEFESDLPITTEILLFFSKALKNYGFIIVPGIFILIFLLIALLRSERVRPYRDPLLLKIPILGYLFKSIAMAGLSRNLGIMLKSGLPITAALETAAQTESNFVYKRALKNIADGVQKGKSIETVITKGKYTEFPPFVSRMIGVGEKSGNLEENLAYLGEYFEAEVDTMTRNMTTIIEPLLLFVIGGGVAFIALSIISPIYQITGSIR